MGNCLHFLINLCFSFHRNRVLPSFKVPLVGKSGVEVSRTDKDMAIAMSSMNPEALVNHALDIIFGEKLAKLSALGERHDNGIDGTIYSTIYGNYLLLY